MKKWHGNRAAIIGLVGITFAAWAGGDVCNAGDQYAAPIDSGTVCNSPNLSLGNNLSDPQKLPPLPSGRDSAFFLDDATSQPGAASDSGDDSGTETKDEAESAATLAKKTLNPVSDLISVPFQYNADFNIGPNNATRSLLNIQPVIPISISDHYNLIIRTILPVVNIESVADGVPSQFGLGDVLQSFFLTPKQKIGGWIIGAGPAFLWPTATNDALGSGKFGLGPTAVVLRQEHGWTYGMLVNQIWSYAGDDKRTSVNSMFVQPFLSYTFPTFTTIGINTESSFNWESHQNSVPINLTVTQILKIAGQPISLQIGPRYYAETVPGGPQWGLRFTFTLLFPK